MLRRNPSYATAIILTLALGIGANTAIFSVVNSVLLKPLPFKDPNRLVIIWETDTKNRATNSPVSSSDLIARSAPACAALLDSIWRRALSVGFAAPQHQSIRLLTEMLETIASRSATVACTVRLSMAGH
jgi:hypothetical protein